VDRLNHRPEGLSHIFERRYIAVVGANPFRIRRLIDMEEMGFLSLCDPSVAVWFVSTSLSDTYFLKSPVKRDTQQALQYDTRSA
jgi:hypothetical protein